MSQPVPIPHNYDQSRLLLSKCRVCQAICEDTIEGLCGNCSADKRKQADPAPLYRAQYECRHCLERFESGLTYAHPGSFGDLYLRDGIRAIEHQCTPDIIGIADLQCFVKQ